LRVTSIERTAYPRFRRLISARALHVSVTPAAEEIAWARDRTAGPESLLALVLMLKCFQKMARFCPLAEIPEAVTGHVRRCLGLDPETVPAHAGYVGLCVRTVAACGEETGASLRPRRYRCAGGAGSWPSPRPQ
jgi:Domain of unknown function (DUF4158)